MIDTFFAPLIGYHGWGRAAQKQHPVIVFQTLQSHIHRLILRRHIRFISRFMLLIQNDDADVFQRRKDTHPGAHHDACLAAADPLPLVISFPPGQLAMHDRQILLAEPACKPVDHLRCKGDFGNQHNCRLSQCQTPVDGFHVDFRLAAGSDAVKEKILLPAGVDGASDPVHRRLLFFCQGFRFLIMSGQTLIRLLFLSFSGRSSCRNKAPDTVPVCNAVTLLHPPGSGHNLFGQRQTVVHTENCLYLFRRTVQAVCRFFFAADPVHIT